MYNFNWNNKIISVYKCDWCNQISDKLIKYKGNNICEHCNSLVTSSHCRKCGRDFPEEFMINGMCLDCVQVEAMHEECEREDDEEDFIGEDDVLNDQLTLSEKQLEQVYLERSGDTGYSPKDFLESKYLRKLWILTKLTLSGITNEQVLHDNIKDVEALVDENKQKIIGKYCKFIIINSLEDRKRLAGMTCIAHKNKVFLIEDKW